MNLLTLLWPPVSLLRARKVLDAREKQAQENLDARSLALRQLARQASAGSKLGDAAKHLTDSEKGRRDTLENKASSYTAGITIALSVVGLLNGLTLQTIPSAPVLIAILVLDALAMIHLLTAAWYAIQVRRVTRLYTISSGWVVERLPADLSEAEFNAALIHFAEINENALLKKSNALYVSEVMFLRGLAMIALLVLLLALAKGEGVLPREVARRLYLNTSA